AHRLFFFSSRRRHTRFSRDWSSDVCSSDLREHVLVGIERMRTPVGDQLVEERRELAHRPVAALEHRLGGNGLERTEDRQRPVARSEERRVGKRVDLGGTGSLKKKKRKRI